MYLKSLQKNKKNWTLPENNTVTTMAMLPPNYGRNDSEDVETLTA